MGFRREGLKSQETKRAATDTRELSPIQQDGRKATAYISFKERRRRQKNAGMHRYAKILVGP
jgi:hypothetical protein